MKTPLLVLVFLANVTLPGSAALMQWRTQVQASTGSGSSLDIQGAGGLNQPSSSISLSNLTGSALGEASSALNAGGFIPTLRTRATANPTRAQAVAWGVQGYTNTLATPLNTSLQLNLTGNITGGNDLDARVYLFQDEEFEFSTDPGTIRTESSSQLWPGFPANDLSPTGFDIDINNFTGPVSEFRNFDFTVAPGDSFYVWARLVATADNPGVSDAFSTLTASLTNTTGLMPAAVPEPGGAMLLAVAAFGFCARRRRTRR